MGVAGGMVHSTPSLRLRCAQWLERTTGTAHLHGAWDQWGVKASPWESWRAFQSGSNRESLNSGIAESVFSTVPLQCWEGAAAQAVCFMTGAASFTRVREIQAQHCFCAWTRIWIRISQIPRWQSYKIPLSRDSQSVLEFDTIFIWINEY